MIMLTNVLRALVNNSFKENFQGEKKQLINVFTDFFIFHKSGVKTYIKWIVNQFPKGTR